MRIAAGFLVLILFLGGTPAAAEAPAQAYDVAASPRDRRCDDRGILSDRPDGCPNQWFDFIPFQARLAFIGVSVLVLVGAAALTEARKRRRRGAGSEPEAAPPG